MTWIPGATAASVPNTQQSQALGTACLNQATCFVSMGQHDRALPLLEQARASLEAAGDNVSVGTVIMYQATCYDNMGQHDRALTLHEQARAMFKKDRAVVFAKRTNTSGGLIFAALVANGKRVGTAVPKCPTAQHVMVMSTGTYNSFICNRCGSGKSGERWVCGNCRDTFALSASRGTRTSSKLSTTPTKKSRESPSRLGTRSTRRLSPTVTPM